MARAKQETNRINNLLGSYGLGQLNEPGTVAALGFLVVDHAHFREMLNGCAPAERVNMYEALRPHLRFPAKPLDVYVAELADLAERKQLPTIAADGSLQPFKIAILGDAGIPPQVKRLPLTNVETAHLRFEGDEPPEQIREKVLGAVAELRARVPAGASLVRLPQARIEGSIEHQYANGVHRIDVYDPSECRFHVRLDLGWTQAKEDDLAVAQACVAEAVAKGWLEMVCIRCTRSETFAGVSKDEAVRAARAAGWVQDVTHDAEVCPKCLGLASK